MFNIVFWTLGISFALIVVLLALFGRRLLESTESREVEQALKDFRVQREQLEARFFDLARSQGKPRGLRWLDCEWLSDVEFARDSQSRLLTAFVAVNIRFEAIEGSDMEDLEYVNAVRDAAAVFHYHRGRWGTGGRVLFNMNPADALSRLTGQYVPVTLAESAPSS